MEENLLPTNVEIQSKFSDECCAWCGSPNIEACRAYPDESNEYDVKIKECLSCSKRFHTRTINGVRKSFHLDPEFIQKKVKYAERICLKAGGWGSHVSGVQQIKAKRINQNLIRSHFNKDGYLDPGEYVQVWANVHKIHLEQEFLVEKAVALKIIPESMKIPLYRQMFLNKK